MELTDRIGNIPFASLISALIIFVGVGVFCGTLYRGLSIIIVNVINDLFQFNVAWLEVIQVVFIVVAVAMAVFAILLLVFAFLATGATRRSVYSGAKCIMGGRVSAAFFMVISYIMNMAWIVILCTGVIPVMMYLIVESMCKHDIYNKDADSLNKYCFELTHYGIYRNSSLPIGIPVDGKDKLCGHNELGRFCDHVAEAGPMFCIACAGAFLIVLGITQFMICLAANYTRIKISKELTEYRDAVDMEELELNSVGKGSREGF